MVVYFGAREGAYGLDTEETCVYAPSSPISHGWIFSTPPQPSWPQLLDISNENAITEVTIELYWISM